MIGGIGALVASFWPYILAAGGLIAAVLGFYVKGRADASDKAKTKAATKRADDLQTAKENRDEVDNLSDDDVAGELHKWSRD